MPLVPTENPARRHARKTISRRRLLGGLLLAGGNAGLVTGCSTGDSRDAERGRRLDAERTSVMDDLQATRTAELVFGTPPSTPATEP